MIRGIIHAETVSRAIAHTLTSKQFCFILFITAERGGTSDSCHWIGWVNHSSDILEEFLLIASTVKFEVF